MDRYQVSESEKVQILYLINGTAAKDLTGRSYLLPSSLSSKPKLMTIAEVPTAAKLGATLIHATPNDAE